jgi:uncharacterized protein with FMN-binding domain
VALGAGAVIAIYAAGLVKTRAAAARFEELPAMRRPAPNPPAITPVEPPVATTPVRAEARVPATPPSRRPLPAASPMANSRADSAPAVSPHSESTPAASTADVMDLPVPTGPTPAGFPVSGGANSAVTDAVSKPADPPVPPKSLYRDGTYSGWGTSRHGEIEATVVIENGRITSAVISDCETRYPCSFIAHLPPQVVVRQSADVDYVTGATQSADAFYYAVLQALSKAR